MSTNVLLNDYAKSIEDSASDVITLVRRQVTYSEIVISKDEFEKVQNNEDCDEIEELKSRMETDEVMQDFGDEEDSWMLFSGDVTSCTDDMIAMTDKKWDHFWNLNV